VAKPPSKPRLPPPSHAGRRPPDLSKLPASIRDSLAKLAGEPAVEEDDAAPIPLPPQPPDTTTQER
jgi:hypothetical protein